MTDDDRKDPTKGPGSTQDPNQADRNAVDPWPDRHRDVPERPEGEEGQENSDPQTGPGTTSTTSPRPVSCRCRAAIPGTGSCRRRSSPTSRAGPIRPS